MFICKLSLPVGVSLFRGVKIFRDTGFARRREKLVVVVVGNCAGVRGDYVGGGRAT